ncbi:MAG TPA: DUF3598 family protein [Leptolyngbyaceae cyanobacterium]
MNLKEQNWNNFYAKHLQDWHGIWTIYSSSGEVTDTFQCVRSFRSNSEQTEITHTNRYTYADGRREEKTWQLYKPSLRSIFFEQGAGAFNSKQLEPGTLFAVELFFRHQDIRHSVVVPYQDGSNLTSMLSIREDAASPSKFWSSDLNLVAERKLSENWIGTRQTMTPDLKVSPALPTQLHWAIEGNETFFFPDGISLSCPGKVKVGMAIAIATNWLVNPTYMQQVTIKYDELGAFHNLTFEQFHLSDDSQQNQD